MGCGGAQRRLTGHGARGVHCLLIHPVLGLPKAAALFQGAAPVHASSSSRRPQCTNVLPPGGAAHASMDAAPQPPDPSCLCRTGLQLRQGSSAEKTHGESGSAAASAAAAASSFAHALPLLGGRLVTVLLPLGPLHARQQVLHRGRGSGAMCVGRCASGQAAGRRSGRPEARMPPARTAPRKQRERRQPHRAAPAWPARCASAPAARSPRAAGVGNRDE